MTFGDCVAAQSDRQSGHIARLPQRLAAHTVNAVCEQYGSLPAYRTLESVYFAW